MGFFGALGKIILGLVLVGVVAGVAGVLYIQSTVLPFLGEKYDDLKRYDVNPVAAHINANVNIYEMYTST
jgi:hypothetical protein